MAALWAEFSDPDEPPDRRAAARRTLRLVAPAIHARIASEVLILNLSTTGLLFETSALLATGEEIEVELPESGPIVARVIWKRDAYYGCEFLTRAPVAAVSSALLSAFPDRRNPPTSSTDRAKHFRCKKPGASESESTNGRTAALILAFAVLAIVAGAAAWLF